MKEDGAKRIMKPFFCHVGCSDYHCDNCSVTKTNGQGPPVDMHAMDSLVELLSKSRGKGRKQPK